MKMMEKNNVQHHREGIAGQEAADVFQFTHPGNGVAHPPCLEVGQRQLHQVPEQAGAQLDVDTAGGVAEHIGAQGVEHALEDDHHHQADDQHVQRGQAFVHQHFVHHNLKEQGADQAEELQHEGDEQHLAQQLAVFDEAGDEPGEVELGQLTCQAGAAGDEDEFTGPLGGKDFMPIRWWVGRCCQLCHLVWPKRPGTRRACRRTGPG